jgi:hypothetical protein
VEIAELAGQDMAEPVTLQEPVEPQVRVVGAIMVPLWREGLTMDVLPDVHRDIVNVIADA